MTTRMLFDELYALNFSELNRFLRKNEDELVNKSIKDFTDEVSNISSKLPTEQQAKVETIIAYTLKDLEEKNYSDLCYLSEIDTIPDTGDARQQKRISDAQHTENKRANISHGLKHIGQEIVKNPHDSKLNEKCASMKKQNHLLNHSGGKE